MTLKGEARKAYIAKRTAEHSNRASLLLGNTCFQCGETQDLKFFRPHPRAMNSDFTRLFTYSWDAIEEELDNCQLLCKDCYSRIVLPLPIRKPGPIVHGTLNGYKRCKCDICRLSWNAYYRERYKMKGNHYGSVSE